MAHVYKRLKTRVSRGIEGVLELRGLGDAGENEILDVCIERLQKAQADIYAIISGAEKLKKAGSRVRVASPPLPAAPATTPQSHATATTAPSAGAAEALPRGPKTWAGREMETPEDDLVAVPAGATDEEWVEYALRGQVGGVSTGEAAKQLSADSATWSVMDARERAAAIRELAARLDADYLASEDQPASGSPAAPQDGGIVF